MGGPARWIWRGVRLKARRSWPAKELPEVALFLQGQGDIASASARSPPWRAMRAGTGETELAFP